MNVPTALRKQIKAYEAAGFHPVAIEPRAGAHFKVTFAEFEQPQIITKNASCPHAIKNNIARYRQLARSTQ